MFSIKNDLSLDFFHMNYRHSVGRNMECDMFETVKGVGIYSLNILKSFMFLRAQYSLPVKVATCSKMKF